MVTEDGLSLSMPQSAKPQQDSNAQDTIYQDLKSREIRILCLSPGQPGSPLEAYLAVADLDAAGTDSSYEAISYAWGEPVFSESINLGQSQHIAITPSLHSALQRARLPDRTRKLWADAICINQKDPSERSAQVASMFDVYAKATRVLVWLGDSTGSEELAFAKLKAGAELRPALMRLLISRVPDIGRRALKMWLKAKLKAGRSPTGSPYQHTYDNRGLQPVVDLFRLPWFSRLWVAQEVVASRSTVVLCGNHSLDWRTIGHGLDFIYQFSVKGMLNSKLELAVEERLFLESLRQTHETIEIIMQAKPGLNAGHFDGLEAFSRSLSLAPRSCTEPHDRIYAVRVLLGLHAFSALDVDYSQPVAIVYANFLKVCLTNKDHLPDSARGATKHVPYMSFALAIAGLEHHSVEPGGATSSDTNTWPTWLADFSRINRIPKVKRWFYYDSSDARMFRASSIRFQTAFDPLEWQLLKVRGRCFGTVGEIFVFKHTEDEDYGTRRDNSTVAGLRAWYYDCFNNPPFKGYVPYEKRILRLLRDGEKNGARFGHLYTVDNTLSPKAEDNAEGFASPETYAEASFGPASRDGHYLRRNIALILTNKGHRLGFVPAATRKGDTVCFFSGTPYPWILREVQKAHEHGEITFNLVGDAWLQDVPEWEAMGLTYPEWGDLTTSRSDTRLVRREQSRDFGFGVRERSPSASSTEYNPVHVHTGVAICAHDAAADISSPTLTEQQAVAVPQANLVLHERGEQQVQRQKLYQTSTRSLNPTEQPAARLHRQAEADRASKPAVDTTDATLGDEYSQPVTEPQLIEGSPDLPALYTVWPDGVRELRHRASLDGGFNAREDEIDNSHNATFFSGNVWLPEWLTTASMPQSRKETTRVPQPMAFRPRHRSSMEFHIAQTRLKQQAGSSNDLAGNVRLPAPPIAVTRDTHGIKSRPRFKTRQPRYQASSDSEMEMSDEEPASQHDLRQSTSTDARLEQWEAEHLGWITLR